MVPDQAAIKGDEVGFIRDVMAWMGMRRVSNGRRVCPRHTEMEV